MSDRLALAASNTLGIQIVEEAHGSEKNLFAAFYLVSTLRHVFENRYGIEPVIKVPESLSLIPMAVLQVDRLLSVWVGLHVVWQAWHQRRWNWVPFGILGLTCYWAGEASSTRTSYVGYHLLWRIALCNITQRISK